MGSLDDITSKLDFTVGGKSAGGTATLLPDPEPRERTFTIVSVDDHIVEPPDLFVGRMPAKYSERAPRVVERDDGTQLWVYEDRSYPNVGFNAVAGRPIMEYSMEPTRFDEMRPGAWRIEERIRDMDINGVFASVNFPSFLPGFAGQRLQLDTDDEELALAVVRAWNDWHLEEWAGYDPTRIIPCQIPYLLDPEIGRREILANAERGFRAISFSEAPHNLGFPSLHTGHWDPVLAACEETGTIVCLHVGSSGTTPTTAPDAPANTVGALFFGSALLAAVDWLFSGAPVRFPNLQLCLSEGGIGWVAALLDRLDHMEKYSAMYGTWTSELTPAETFQRNFWVCALSDPSAFRIIDRIGVEHVLVESDYPHADSTWPDTQETVRSSVETLSHEDVERVTWRNAEALFRHPVPDEAFPDGRRPA